MKMIFWKILFTILLLFIFNNSFAVSAPRYIKLDITKGETFTGADNTLHITNNSGFDVINWYGSFNLPKNTKIWSASSSIVTPLKKTGVRVFVNSESWNKTIISGETVKIEFNTDAAYNQTVSLTDINFIGTTEEVFEDVDIPANEEVLIVVKKREADGGYDTIRKNIINVYNNYFNNTEFGEGVSNKQYNIVLLIPMIELKTEAQQETEYNKYLSKDFIQWAVNGLNAEAQVDYSTVGNVIKYLKSPNLKYIYYVGDGGMMTCSGIECTNPSATPIWDPIPNLTADDISKIKFKDDQIWILNACHGIIGSFPLALYNSGLRHYTAGATSLYQPFDSDLGVFAFANVLNGMTLSDAMKKAGNKVSEMYYENPSSFKGYGYLFNGVWGVIDGANCYLFDTLAPNIEDYNKKIIMPKKPTLKTWPFQWFSY